MLFRLLQAKRIDHDLTLVVSSTWHRLLLVTGVTREPFVIVAMASNFNGDTEDVPDSEIPKPRPRGKSRTKSEDELVAKMEEQNR